MNEQEKFFKALNEGRVVLKSPDADVSKNNSAYGGYGRFAGFDHGDENWFSLADRRIAIIPPRDADE